jgi:hypothetical protein
MTGIWVRVTGWVHRQSPWLRALALAVYCTPFCTLFVSFSIGWHRALGWALPIFGGFWVAFFLGAVYDYFTSDP